MSTPDSNPLSRRPMVALSAARALVLAWVNWSRIVQAVTRLWIEHRPLLWILVLALAIRVTFLVVFQPWDQDVLRDKVLYGDANDYHQRALGLVTDLPYNTFEPYKPPMYPIFLAALYAVTGSSTTSVIAVQVLLNTITVLVVFLLGKELFRYRLSAYLGSLFYALSIFGAWWALNLLTETVFTLLFVLSIYFFVLAVKRRLLRNIVIAAFLLGLATLTRPVALYFPLVFFVTIVLLREPLKRRALLMLAFGLTFAATLMPWQVRNLVTYGSYGVSTVSGNALLQYNVAIAKAQSEDISLARARIELSRNIGDLTNPFERSAAMKRAAIEYIVDNPVTYAKYHIKGMLNVFIGIEKGPILYGLMGMVKPPNSNPRVNEISGSESFAARIARVKNDLRREFYLTPILALKSLVEYGLFSFGIIIMLTRGNRVMGIMLVLTLVYFSGIPGAVAYARFKAPLIPLYLTASGFGAYVLWNFVRRKPLLPANPQE